MNNSFHIPELTIGVPRSIAPLCGRQQAARLARCLLDAGVIHGDVNPRQAREPLAVCRTYLERWVGERLTGLRCLRPGFRLLVGRSSHPFGTPAEGRSGDATIVWYSECSAFAVGAALERLEQIVPKLGATVLAAIDRANMQLIPTVTPSDVLGIAQEHYWYGERDETVALDEQCGDDPEQRAAMRLEMVTREGIDAAFPAWATQWSGERKRLRRGELQRIAQGARSPRVRRVAEAALALDRLDLGDAYRPQGDGWFVGYGAVLTWRPDDLAVRVFDDFANDAVQGDYVDWIGEFEFDIGEPDALREWLAAMEPRLEGMRQLDALIHELSSGDWRRVQKGINA